MDDKMCHRYDFWYVFGTDLHFFELFKFYFHLGLIMNPHVFYVHMTYVYSLSYVPFFTRLHGQEKSLLYYDLFNFRIIILQTHPDPHLSLLFLPPFLPQPHPHDTHHPSLHSTAQLGEGHGLNQLYEEPADILSTLED